MRRRKETKLDHLHHHQKSLLLPCLPLKLPLSPPYLPCYNKSLQSDLPNLMKPELPLLPLLNKLANLPLYKPLPLLLHLKESLPQIKKNLVNLLQSQVLNYLDPLLR